MSKKEILIISKIAKYVPKKGKFSTDKSSSASGKNYKIAKNAEKMANFLLINWALSQVKSQKKA